MRHNISYKLVREKFCYDPDTGILIRRKGGYEAGSIDGSGPDNSKLYKRTYLENGVTAYVHRIIWVWMTGEQPDTIDHIDGDGLNNRWGNLRSIPARLNGRNQKIFATNTSGFSGVTERKDNGKWRARIMVDGKMIDLGTYQDKQDAINARKDAEREYSYEMEKAKRY